MKSGRQPLSCRQDSGAWLKHSPAPARKLNTVVGFACILAGLGLANATWAQQTFLSDGLAYDVQTQGPVPIPPSERTLQTVVATSWFQVSNEGVVLEGAIFDHSGKMFFCDVSGRRVLRLTPDRQLATVVGLDKLSPGGLGLHEDGRLFVAALDIPDGVGAIMAVNPDGSGLQAIISPEAGYMPNDLVFDANGGFYFTDFEGTATDAKGGVYYVASDLATIR